MATFSLQDIQDAAEAKYGPCIIEGIPGGDVTLVNALRLPKAKRDALVALQAKANDETATLDDSLNVLKQIVTIAAKTPAEATRLLKAIGDDQTMLATVIEKYGEASQQGEITPSE